MTYAREIASYLDEVLSVAAIPDYPTAWNGLQLDHQGPVTALAAAVDFSRRSVEGAIAAAANFMIVHHGMFWDDARPIVGTTYNRLRLAIAHDVAVYAAHLPLDVHESVGNNVLLAAALELEPTGRWARFQELPIGVRGETDLETRVLIERARAFAAKWNGSAIATQSAPERRTRQWAICSGAGASSETIREARRLGIDTLIVGEGPHHSAVEAYDAGIVIIYAGHYATETLGVQALARKIGETFGVRWHFIHAPTGL